MTDTRQMAESEFHKRVDAILASLEAAFDDVAADIDTELNGGILTLAFANGSKVIVNRQTPNREIWVAAKSGGFHFRWVDQDNGADTGMGAWLDTRTAETLQRVLSRVISLQAESVIAITF